MTIRRCGIAAGWRSHSLYPRIVVSALGIGKLESRNLNESSSRQDALTTTCALEALFQNMERNDRRRPHPTSTS